MAARVELRDLPSNASWHERDAAFKNMFRIFNKLVAEAGIKHELKRREYYESPGEKRRRKKKESANNRLKTKLRENFSERPPKKENNE